MYVCDPMTPICSGIEDMLTRYLSSLFVHDDPQARVVLGGTNSVFPFGREGWRPKPEELGILRSQVYATMTDVLFPKLIVPVSAMNGIASKEEQRKGHIG